MPDKVAIVCLAPGWQDAPFNDPEWETWGLNDGYLLFGPDRPCTRWFELHGDTPLTRARRESDYFDRMREMDIPVYYLHGDPPTPAAIRLDTDALARVGRDYFACTNAYQIALALLWGFKEIAIYGSPLQTNREVVVERPCVSYWLGLAEGRGVKVTAHYEGSIGPLRHPYRYALEDAEERTATFWAALTLSHSLGYWLPQEAERLGLVAPMLLEDA